MPTKLLSLFPKVIQITHIQGNAIAINKQNAQISAYKMLFCQPHYVLMFHLRCTRATGINYERSSKQGRKLKNAGNGKQNWAGREEEFVNVKAA